MTTKPRTKKPAAKPKRYVRVAVKAGKATLQESDHPARGFKPRQPKPTAEDIGRSIGNVLGRKLDDLLAGREVTSSGVHAWTVEKNCDKITAAHNGKAEPARLSRIEDAMDRLSRAVSAAEALSEEEKRRLGLVLSDADTINTCAGVTSPCRPPGLANAIFDLADRLLDDNNRRSELLDRLEL